MIRVKVTTMFPYSPLVRQTPGSTGRWGDCQFLVDNDDPDCDFWVVYGPMRQDQTANCPKGNTILFDDEPPDVRVYDRRYVRQFGTVMCCQPQVDHPNLILGRPAPPWHVGVNRMNEAMIFDYDAFRAMTHVDKSKLISVVCSSKAATAGHRLRLRFVERLREHFGARIDTFGRGFMPVGDKWEAVAPYMYHIVLENSSIVGNFSEKLTDSYLAGAYPLYYGCPNLSDYFPPQSYSPIDIHDPGKAIETIEQVISDDLYESRLQSVWEARRLVLDRYNFFAVLAQVCGGMPVSRRERTTIRPEWACKASPLSLRNAKAGVRRVIARLVSPARRAA